MKRASAFKELKNDPGLRPIHHRLEQRIEAHIYVAFMAFCLQVLALMGLQLPPQPPPKISSPPANRSRSMMW